MVGGHWSPSRGFDVSRGPSIHASHAMQWLAGDVWLLQRLQRGLKHQWQAPIAVPVQAMLCASSSSISTIMHGSDWIWSVSFVHSLIVAPIWPSRSPTAAIRVPTKSPPIHRGGLPLPFNIILFCYLNLCNAQSRYFFLPKLPSKASIALPKYPLFSSLRCYSTTPKYETSPAEPGDRDRGATNTASLRNGRFCQAQTEFCTCTCKFESRLALFSMCLCFRLHA